MSRYKIDGNTARRENESQQKKNKNKKKNNKELHKKM